MARYMSFDENDVFRHFARRSPPPSATPTPRGASSEGGKPPRPGWRRRAGYGTLTRHGAVTSPSRSSPGRAGEPLRAAEGGRPDRSVRNDPVPQLRVSGDTSCTNGFSGLKREVGLAPDEI